MIKAIIRYFRMVSYEKELAYLNMMAQDNIYNLEMLSGIQKHKEFNVYIEWYYTDLDHLNRQYGLTKEEK